MNSSYGAGMLPISVTLSQNKIRGVSVFGMGVLVGTSLMIIIPEGVETLYDSVSLDGSGKIKRQEEGESKPVTVVANLLSPTEGIGLSEEMDDDVDGGQETKTPQQENVSQARYVGIMLLSGFMLMYLIDHFDLIHGSLSNNEPKYTGLDEDFLPSMNSPSTLAKYNPIAVIKLLAASPTTLGLVIHSLADGVALGSSVATNNAGLEAIVFLAIVIHKLPASFGLGAVLLGSELSTSTMKMHLLCFALSAPIGAFLTYFSIVLIGSNGSSSIAWWTGALLLLSGGTFLYVAVHVMQELTSESDHRPTSSGTDSTFVRDNSMNIKELGLSVLGMMVPVVVSVIREE